MSEKQITNRTFANLKKALAIMPQMATDLKTDVYLQHVLYGTRVETDPFLFLRATDMADKDAIETILNNWHNLGIEYIIRTAEEMINGKSEYIAKQVYGGKHIEVVKVKPTRISDIDIDLTIEDIEKGKSDITLTQVCEAAYGEFHRLNIGYQFARKNDNGITVKYEKIVLFAMFSDDVETLKMLTANEHPEFKRINKTGWKNGILIPKKYYGKS